MRTVRFMLCALLSAWFSVPADEPLGPPPPPEAGQIRALEQRAMALELLRRLDLTDAQAREILALARDAAFLKTGRDSRSAAIRREQKEAFAAFRKEAFEGVGFTAPVERGAAQADHRGQDLQKEFADRVATLEKRAPLTEVQRGLVEQVQRKGPAALFRPGKIEAERPLGEVEKLRGELAEIHKQKYGAIGPVGRFLLQPALAEVIGRRLSDAGAPAPKEEAPT